MQYELDLTPPQASVRSGPVARGHEPQPRDRLTGDRHLHHLPAESMPVLLGSLLRQWARRPATRWITWVAPPCVPTPAACRRHRLPASRHRLVFPRRRQSLQRVLERALSAGTSHVVLAWRTPADHLDEGVLARLARQSDCRLYLFDTSSRTA